MALFRYSHHEFIPKKIFSTSALLSLIAIFILSCSGNHLICDSQYRETTEKAFNQRKHLAINRDTALFSVFNQKLSLKQSEALKFLYAYMPLSDLADYNGNFFLANADISLRSKSETAWGKDIPEEVFLHYVLPCRIKVILNCNHLIKIQFLNIIFILPWHDLKVDSIIPLNMISTGR